jgi:hypothetical protein
MKATQTPKKPKRGCLRCVGILGVLLVGCGLLTGGTFLASRLSRSLGIFGPTAEELYSGTVDRQASASVTDLLLNEGLEGASALVIPIKGSNGQIAIITVDESKGFVGLSPGDETEDPVYNLVSQLSNANNINDLDLERIAIDYRDETGENVLSFTSSQENIDAYANGDISEQEFLGAVEFNLNEVIDYFGVGELYQQWVDESVDNVLEAIGEEIQESLDN